MDDRTESEDKDLNEENAEVDPIENFFEEVIEEET